MRRSKEIAVYAFLGVVDFFAGAFLGFFGAIFLTSGTGALVLVTRPDLVLPRTTGGFSSTAGAWENVSMIATAMR